MRHRLRVEVEVDDRPPAEPEAEVVLESAMNVVGLSAKLEEVVVSHVRDRVV